MGYRLLVVDRQFGKAFMRDFRSRRKFQRGQAMVELAILAPLLIVLMLAVGYFGHAVSSQQLLNAAARNAARDMAIESTAGDKLRMLGNYEAKPERLQELAQHNLRDIIRANQLSVKSSTNFNYDLNNYLDSSSRFSKLTEQRFLYLHSQSNVNAASLVNPPARDQEKQEPGNLSSLTFGIGALFYGGTLQYELNELEPIARYIGLNTGIRIGATSLMPAELPLRGTPYGLLEINPWLSDLITEDVSNSANYPNLIED